MLIFLRFIFKLRSDFPFFSQFQKFEIAVKASKTSRKSFRNTKNLSCLLINRYLENTFLNQNRIFRCVKYVKSTTFSTSSMLSHENIKRMSENKKIFMMRLTDKLKSSTLILNRQLLSFQVKQRANCFKTTILLKIQSRISLKMKELYQQISQWFLL